MNKRIILFLIFGFMFFFVLDSVYALGISPGRTTLDFNSGASEKVQFSIVNSEHKDMKIIFYVRGDMKDYVVLDKQSADFRSSEESKTFTYTINFPKVSSSYGTTKTEIVALEVPADSSSISPKDNYMGASLAVITQLYVNVLYPNKYAEAELTGAPDLENGRVKFFIPMHNKGKLDIARASAVIDIYSSTNEKLTTIRTNEMSLKSNEKKELSAEWIGDINPGKYRAVASVLYDGETINLEKVISVGNLMLEIEEIVVRNFQLGEIAKFETLVNNRWGDNVSDVTVQIQIYNENGEVMADFNSPLYDISPLSKKTIVSYWDSVGAKAGDYDGKLFLRYAGSSAERAIQVKIRENSIVVIGATGRAVISSSDSGGFSLQTILILGIAILVLMNIIWIVIVLKRYRRKKVG